MFRQYDAERHPTDDERKFCRYWVSSVLKSGAIDDDVVEARQLLDDIDDKTSRSTIFQEDPKAAQALIDLKEAVNGEIIRRNALGIEELNERVRQVGGVMMDVPNDEGDDTVVEELSHFILYEDGLIHPVSASGKVLPANTCRLTPEEVEDE